MIDAWADHIALALVGADSAAQHDDRDTTGVDLRLRGPLRPPHRIDLEEAVAARSHFCNVAGSPAASRARAKIDSLRALRYPRRWP